MSGYTFINKNGAVLHVPETTVWTLVPSSDGNVNLLLNSSSDDPAMRFTGFASPERAGTACILAADEVLRTGAVMFKDGDVVVSDVQS